jgi:hypothetical protein
MKRKASLLLLFVVGLLAGCVSGNPGNIIKSAIAVEMLPSAPAKVSSYSLRQEDGKLVVAGRVTSLNPIRIPGHVDLVVCGPDGQTVSYYQAPINDYASKRGGLKSARFSADITPVPTDGSTVRLQYDAPPTNEDHLLVCQKESIASR